MESLFSSITSYFDGGASQQAFTGIMDIPTSLLILIVALCLFGTNVIANITARDNFLEYGVTFSSLFLGALMSNKYIAHIELPVSSEFAHSIIIANIGMTCAGLFLMGAYGTQRS